MGILSNIFLSNYAVSLYFYMIGGLIFYLGKPKDMVFLDNWLIITGISILGFTITGIFGKKKKKNLKNR